MRHQVKARGKDLKVKESLEKARFRAIGAVMIGAMVVAVVVKAVGVVRGMIVGIAEDIKAVVVLAGTMVGEAAGGSAGSRYLLFDLSDYMISIL